MSKTKAITSRADKLQAIEKGLSVSLGVKSFEGPLEASLAMHLGLQAASLMPATGKDFERLMFGMQGLNELQPKGELQAMLSIQILGVHERAVDYMTRAMQNDSFTDTNLNRATKLMRLFRDQIDTLHRLQGKAGTEQRHVVEHRHIHIHQGKAAGRKQRAAAEVQQVPAITAGEGGRESDEFRG